VVLVGLKLISVANWLLSVLLHCWLSHLICKNRPRNDLLSVEWDVKLLLTHSVLYHAVSAKAVEFYATPLRRLMTEISSISETLHWSYLEWPNVQILLNNYYTRCAELETENS